MEANQVVFLLSSRVIRELMAVVKAIGRSAQSEPSREALVETIREDLPGAYIDKLYRFGMFATMLDFVSQQGSIGRDAIDTDCAKRALPGGVDQNSFSALDRVQDKDRCLLKADLALTIKVSAPNFPDLVDCFNVHKPRHPLPEGGEGTQLFEIKFKVRALLRNPEFRLA
jgi:hypothetical protein